MENLITGATSKLKKHPIWNAKSLRGYDLPSLLNLRDGQSIVLNSSNKLVYSQVTSYAIEGLQISNNVSNSTTRVDISSGFCNTTIGNIHSVGLISAITKRLDATWSPGTNNGGLFSGVSLSNTTYHVFLIYNPISEVVDVGFDTSVIAANRPSGWSARRIGSILRESGAILGFVQTGNYFLLKTVKIDLSSILVSTTDTLYTLTVPKGLSVITNSLLSAGLDQLASFSALEVRSPSKSSRSPALTPGFINFQGMGGSFYDAGYGIYCSSTTWVKHLTNTAGQLVFVRSAGDYLSSQYGVTLQTHGWQDIQLNNGM